MISTNLVCDKYAGAVYAIEEAAVLMPGSAMHNVSQCGVVEVPLIVGGVATGVKEFPHMALIGYKKKPNLVWLCGGTLISERYVLTAAHCSSSKENGEATCVKLGDRSANDDDDKDANRQVVQVSKRINHPEYKGYMKYNDIALLHLETEVSFNGHVRPACLHTEVALPWTKAIATGFGKESYQSQTGSKSLLKVQLSLIAKDKCTAAYEEETGQRDLPKGIIDSQLCAGEVQGGKDTCQGDSGGPLQQVLEKPYCMYTVLGVTSFGKFCGFRNSPAVYTRVSSYVPWIEGIVWQ